jgi:PPOX class probable F420-dependent enzyme
MASTPTTQLDLGIPDSHADLLRAPATVALSTVNDDGTVQTTAVWADLGDDAVLRISLSVNRHKYRNLVQRPLATVFSLDPTNPYRSIEIRGRVTLSPDPDGAFARVVLEGYGSSPEMIAELLTEKRVIVTFEPVRVVAKG